MKHVFIVNPISGKADASGTLVPQIIQVATKRKLDYQIILTEYHRHAIELAKAAAESGEPVRLYACGGDGTLFEVVNGSFGFKNAEVGSIPLGSGNDFIRLFGTKEDFLNLEGQINGTAIEIDAIRCGDKIAVNQCSMGLDAEICAKQASFKKLPVMKAETAYYASLLYCFIGKMKSEFTISIDDGEPEKLTVLFCLGANSRWYGSGFMGAPLAMPDDGLLDFIIVKKNMPRAKMLKLIEPYKKGQHLGWDITKFVRGKKINIKSDKPAAVNIDGETEYVTESTFEIVEKSVKFVVPAGSDYFERVRNGIINPDTPIPAEE